MTDEIEDYYEIEMVDEPTDERLPKVIRDWTNMFGQVSRQNEYPATLAYFNLLGAILKDYVIIPFGYTMEDCRIHVCWIQNARSGKSVLNDFYSTIAKKTFNKIDELENNEEPYHTLFDIIDTTDAALIGATKKVPNPDYIKDRETGRYPEGEAKEIDIPVIGALEGSGIALFDEFESVGIFTKKANKDNVTMYFQRFMNKLTTDGYLISKKLAHGPTIICDCQRSVFATTYPPEHLTEVITQKGVLQRMFLYIREVPKDTLHEMRSELVHSIGTIKEINAPTDKYAKSMILIYNEVKMRIDEGTRPQEMVTFADGCTDVIDSEYKNMIKYLEKLPEKVRKVVSSFETNTLLYLTKFAVLCTIAEMGREDNQRWVVYPRNIRQGAWIVRQGYMSLVAWMSTYLRAERVSVADNVGIDEYTNAYHNCNNKDGWVNKAEMKIMCEERHDIPPARFYRVWPKISYRFRSKKIGKTTYVKLKEVEE